MFLSNWGYEKASNFWFEPTMVIPLSIDSPPLEEQTKTCNVAGKGARVQGFLRALGAEHWGPAVG